MSFKIFFEKKIKNTILFDKTFEYKSSGSKNNIATLQLP